MLLNKWVFTILLILSISILTTINNYYFYAHVERENERGSKRIKLLINNTLQLCQDNNIDSSICNTKIVETINDVSKYYYYTAGASIKDFQGNILWRKVRSSHDQVAVLYIDISLPDLNTSTIANFRIDNKWSNSNIALSVLRSMTFSIFQLIETYNQVEPIIETYDELNGAKTKATSKEEIISLDKKIIQKRINDKAQKDNGIDDVKTSVTLHRFTTVAWYRSRPTIGFAIFSFVLLWLYKRKEDDRVKMDAENDAKIKAEFEKELGKIKQLEVDVQTAEETTETLEKEKKIIDGKYTELYNKLKQYDDIINPPINTLNFDDLISLDTSGIGNKFRKTIEKLLLPIFQYQFNYEAKNLSEAIYKLSERKTISKEAKNYADIIRVYGNIDSHYNDQDNISKDEVIALANYVIKIVEEIVEKKLLSINIENSTKDTTSTSSDSSIDSVKSTGLRIVKKVNKD